MQTNATLHDAGMYMNDIILILTFSDQLLYIKHFIMSYRLRNIEFARLKHLQQLER
jgi:hypothetical protein